MCPCLYPGDVDLSTSSCASLATVTAGPRIRVVRFFRSLRTLVFSSLGGVVVPGLLHLEKPLFVALFSTRVVKGRDVAGDMELKPITV